MPGTTTTDYWGLSLRRFARLPSRVLAVTSAMFLGAVGAIALASPAQATLSKITYELECGAQPGTAKIAWTVENELYKDATVTAVDRTLTGVAVGTTVSARKKVTGTEEVVIADNEEVSLSVSLTWVEKPFEFVKKADLSKLDCSPRPTAEFTDKCDGSTVVKVLNPEGAKPVRIAVNGKDEWVERKDLAAGETWEVTVPAAYSGYVRVGPPGGRKIIDHKWAAPENCFEVTHTSSCDELSITVKNTGTTALKATIKVGDEEETTEIAAGKDDTATFEGVEGLVVTLTVNKTVSEIKWTEPANCGTTLPVTGVNAGLLAGAALVLVAGGGGLFYLARRRRIRFAA